ncbi:hypothetical protein [Flavobacterium sp. UBA6195]|uniref:hypothetical protein n=1 Tax=Flavobacterium sp. UBA6195 TaxID=1946554 RepID=UPI0025C0F42D|nr:hypothetical protein [Flavobacterium sp. UBA6195]
MRKSGYTLLLLIILQTNYASSQTTTIIHLLQKNLKQENEARQMVHTEVDSLGNEIGYIQQDIDSLEVAELTIKNDTLFYTTKQKMLYEKGYYLEQQMVALQDIRAVTKDIGIFFETSPDKVTLIRKEYFDDGNYTKSSTTKDLFRTHFVSLRQNEYLADELIKAFKKAGYKIEKGYWYD